jgi:hypothetical protein
MVQTRKRANLKQDVSSDDEMDNTIKIASEPNTQHNNPQGSAGNNMVALMP